MRTTVSFEGSKTSMETKCTDIELPFAHRLKILETNSEVDIIMYYPDGTELQLESIIKER